VSKLTQPQAVCNIPVAFPEEALAVILLSPSELGVKGMNPPFHRSS
jgi:hypothetical protein